MVVTEVLAEFQVFTLQKKIILLCVFLGDRMWKMKLRLQSPNQKRKTTKLNGCFFWNGLITFSEICGHRNKYAVCTDILGYSEDAYLKWCSTCDGPCGVRIDYEEEMISAFMIGVITEHLGLMDVKIDRFSQRVLAFGKLTY